MTITAPPLQAPLTLPDGMISPVWQQWFTTVYKNYNTVGLPAPTATSGGTFTSHYGGTAHVLGEPTKWIQGVADGVQIKIPGY